jgi:hypothetical protein
MGGCGAGPEIATSDSENSVISLAVLILIFRADSGRVAMYLDYFGDDEILEFIKDTSVPYDALTNSEDWARICHIRGRNLDSVSDGEWKELCTVRGKLLAGFEL